MRAMKLRSNELVGIFWGGLGFIVGLIVLMVLIALLVFRDWTKR